MRETSTLYAVTCSACRLHLVATIRVTDPEIAVLDAHLRACRASEPLADAPQLGEIMRRVLVNAVKRVWAS